MWFYFNDAFLSIVENRDDAGLLHVRARHAGDIERVFPDVKVQHTPDGDYQYRADIERQTVARVIAQRISGIDYDNFKNSVLDYDRHIAYLAVWQASQRLQD
jgi:hypothetical protein